jgi:hypothetical protein
LTRRGTFPGNPKEQDGLRGCRGGLYLVERRSLALSLAIRDGFGRQRRNGLILSSLWELGTGLLRFAASIELRRGLAAGALRSREKLDLGQMVGGLRLCRATRPRPLHPWTPRRPAVSEKGVAVRVRQGGNRTGPVRLALLAGALALATVGSPVDSGAAGCAAASRLAPIPPDSERFRPVIVNPDLWAQPTIRPEHPRLYVTAEGLKRLRARWRDPAYQAVADLYRGKKDPLSLALQYLATGDSRACHAAVPDALAEPYKLAGRSQAVYGDDSSLVFDWCYGALSTAERTALVRAIDSHNASRETALGKRFQWHEAHFLGFHAYLQGVLAVEGEPGAGPRLAKAAAAIQNYTEFANEVHGDGTYKTYAYQDLFLVTPAILWSIATGEDVVRRNQFLLHRPEVLLRLLSADGRDFMPGPGDQIVDGAGMLQANQRPSALGPLILAGYLRDGLAQFTGERIRKSQGWGRPADPQWLALLLVDDAVKPLPPDAAKIPGSRLLPIGGMVNFRSGWNFARPGKPGTVGWYYVGPRTEHAEPDAGHVTIWRGDDDLIVSGANYFGSPSAYRDRWGGLSFSRNTMVFSLAASLQPDRDGSQLGPDPGQARRLSAEHYPVANRLIWYPGAILYQGAITDYRDEDGIETATGDATAAYDPRHVKRYLRTIVFVSPDLFIIRDRFSLQDVSRVRALFHMRQAPEIAELRLVQGRVGAGILEAEGDRAIVERGQSRATIQLLWPRSAKLRAVGGEGYEDYIDGSDVDPASTAQDWVLDPRRKDLGWRMEAIRGQWRLEIETDPGAAKGEMITAISVGPRASVPPHLALRMLDGKEVVAVEEGGRQFEVRLPAPDGTEPLASACRQMP